MVLITIANHLCLAGHELETQPHDLSSAVAGERIGAEEAIIEKIGKLEYEIGGNKVYQPFHHSSNARPELSRFGQAHRRRTPGSTV